MTDLEIHDFFEIVKIDEGENQWAKEFEQLAIKPADEPAEQDLAGSLTLRGQSPRQVPSL